MSLGSSNYDTERRDRNGRKWGQWVSKSLRRRRDIGTVRKEVEEIKAEATEKAVAMEAEEEARHQDWQEQNGKKASKKTFYKETTTNPYNGESPRCMYRLGNVYFVEVKWLATSWLSGEERPWWVFKQQFGNKQRARRAYKMLGSNMMENYMIEEGYTRSIEQRETIMKSCSET